MLNPKILNTHNPSMTPLKETSNLHIDMDELLQIPKPPKTPKALLQNHEHQQNPNNAKTL